MGDTRQYTLQADGFSLVELTVVVTLLAVLVLLAVPIYVSASANAEKNTCFQNQNTLQRAAEVYLSVNMDASRSDIEGIVNDAHPIRTAHIVGATPRCPAGDKPEDAGNPTLAEGAYFFDDQGNVEPCTLGSVVPHGGYAD